VPPAQRTPSWCGSCHLNRPCHRVRVIRCRVLHCSGVAAAQRGTSHEHAVGGGLASAPACIHAGPHRRRSDASTEYGPGRPGCVQRPGVLLSETRDAPANSTSTGGRPCGSRAGIDWVQGRLQRGKEARRSPRVAGRGRQQAPCRVPYRVFCRPRGIVMSTVAATKARCLFLYAASLPFRGGSAARPRVAYPKSGGPEWNGCRASTATESRGCRPPHCRVARYTARDNKRQEWSRACAPNGLPRAGACL